MALSRELCIAFNALKETVPDHTFSRLLFGESRYLSFIAVVGRELFFFCSFVTTVVLGTSGEEELSSGRQ